MTDGILWRFYQFRTVVKGNKATLATRVSEDVLICEMLEGGPNFNFDRLAEELLNTFQQSLATRRLSTLVPKADIAIQKQPYIINQYLDFGDRRVVLKASSRDPQNESRNAGVLLKFPIYFFTARRKIRREDSETIRKQLGSSNQWKMSSAN